MSTVITQAPDRTLRCHSAEAPSPGEGEVLVKILASPVNQLDLLVLAGKYPVQPKHKYNGESIVGYDGVGEVISCGAGVTNLAPGDSVIPSQFGVGTWRSQAAVKATMLQKISTPKAAEFACLLRMAVGPGYFLVEEIRNLKPGEFIIQNAGTSAVAQYVTQFANRRGVGVIHVIRDRPDAEAEAVKQALLSLGAAEVFTESEIVDKVASLKQSKRITLALDSVYGASGSTILAALADEGTFVHMGFLGGVNGKLQLGPQDLFGRRLTLRGFRGSAHMAARTPEEQGKLLDFWVDLFNKDQLKLPALGLSFVDWRTSDGGQAVFDAVKRAQEAKLGQRKQVLIFK
ncbi:hypothetical protein F4821DRAFT_244855 [Hypoxylon rubiginosum]|uniref:Uncharacterized protein n=1 Tax=Hypoxylon rubiginosum TaxID=110542 RepID=A0ACC0CSZ6_9PEZI|nr:hypothetical protein F4821DRAFT_244855 [Hypoxylon rubiginosum]